jgi:hypothetical protein
MTRKQARGRQTKSIPVESPLLNPRCYLTSATLQFPFTIFFNSESTLSENKDILFLSQSKKKKKTNRITDIDFAPKPAPPIAARHVEGTGESRDHGYSGSPPSPPQPPPQIKLGREALQALPVLAIE